MCIWTALGSTFIDDSSAVFAYAAGCLVCAGGVCRSDGCMTVGGKFAYGGVEEGNDNMPDNDVEGKVSEC